MSAILSNKEGVYGFQKVSKYSGYIEAEGSISSTDLRTTYCATCPFFEKRTGKYSCSGFGLSTAVTTDASFAAETGEINTGYIKKEANCL